MDQANTLERQQTLEKTGHVIFGNKIVRNQLTQIISNGGRNIQRWDRVATVKYSTADDQVD